MDSVLRERFAEQRLAEEKARDEPLPMAAFERSAWDVYFASLVSFQLHPGNHCDPEQIELTPYERLADRMILRRRARY